MSIDQENNQRALSKLIELLKTGKVLIFVGSGSSVRVGYPTWDDLLKKMADEVRSYNSNIDLTEVEQPGDLLWKAQELRKYLGEDRYFAFPRREFTPKNKAYNRFHQNLLKIRFQHVLTTNFDPVLEHAQASINQGKLTYSFCWDENANLCEFLRRQDDLSYERRIAYVHGKFDKPESIVLTDKDYTSRYANYTLQKKALWGFIAMRSIVFIGFGLVDLDFMQIFRYAQAELGAGEPNHFALLGLKQDEDGGTKRRMYRDKYGIDPIFFEIVVLEKSGRGVEGIFKLFQWMFFVIIAMFAWLGVIL